MAEISYRQEVYRKLIHLSSLWIPFAMYFLDRRDALLILGIVCGFVMMVELARKYSRSAASIINSTGLLRSREAGLTGAAYMLVSAVLTAGLFPRHIASVSFFILIISDTVAALIGRKWGSHKLLNKSAEGSLAFFISGLAIVLVFGNLAGMEKSFYIAGFAGIFTAAITELASGKIGIDDNLSIPLTTGFIMLAVEKLFFRP